MPIYRRSDAAPRIDFGGCGINITYCISGVDLMICGGKDKILLFELMDCKPNLIHSLSIGFKGLKFGRTSQAALTA